MKFLIRVEWGWIGLNPTSRIKKRVESGWSLRVANRGGSGSPPGPQGRVRGGSGWSGSYGRTMWYISFEKAWISVALQHSSKKTFIQEKTMNSFICSVIHKNIKKSSVKSCWAFKIQSLYYQQFRFWWWALSSCLKLPQLLTTPNNSALFDSFFMNIHHKQN